MTIHQRVWRMAGPIILSNVSVPLLGAVDTAVVGHLPEAYYIGAVGVGAVIFSFIFFIFNFLRMGTTAPTAQAVGADDWAEVRAMLGRAWFLALLIGTGLILLQLPIVTFAIWIVEASDEGEVLAERYFLIRIWAAPAALSTYAIIGWFYGMQETRIPLVLQVGINVVNILLDLLFVFGFGWGVEGVAAASLIAEYAGVCVAVYFVHRHLKHLPLARNRVRIFDFTKIKLILTFNSFIFLRTLCVVSGTAIFMTQGAKLGDVPLAANHVLYNLMLITSFGLDGLANTAEALIGQAIGRGDRGAFDRAARAVLLWSGVVGVVNFLIYWLFGSAIIALLTDIEAVRMAAAVYLPWAIVMPLISVWAFTFDGIFLGAGRARTMLSCMLFSFVVYMVAMFTLLPAYDNHALWVALNVFLGFRGLTLMLCYPRLRRELKKPMLSR